LSLQSGKRDTARRLSLAAVAVAVSLTGLTACSSSGPAKPADGLEEIAPRSAAEAPAADAAAIETGGADARVAAADAADEPRESRRERRRRGSAETAPESTEMPAEVPARAAESYARALDAMAAQDWVEAELELEQLVLQFDQFAGPQVNLAIIYHRDGRDDEATAALERALAIAPGHPAANNELGIILREQGRFDEAEAAYRHAIESEPSYALAHYNLGVLLDIYLHRESEALAAYEAYQDALAEPDEIVGRWIIDLRRRLGITDQTARVAPGEGP
jgi:tetratricopeptide (TPR) repeat protein